MYKSNLKIKPSTAWVKPLVMSSVEHSNKITHVNVKLLRWIRSVIWENCVNYIKTTDISLCTNAKALMKHAIAVPWENVQLGYTLMHMELYAKGLHSTSMQIPWRIWIMRFWDFTITSICRASSLLSLWLTSIFQSTIELLYFCQCTNSSKCVLSRCVCWILCHGWKLRHNEFYCVIKVNYVIERLLR